MHNVLKFVSVVVLIFVTGASRAGSFNEQIPNGCGPVGFDYFVPDSLPISGCKFQKACFNHDKCYSRCAPGGDLYGNLKCSNQTLKDNRQNRCDKSMFLDIIETNNDRNACRFYARLYYRFVSTFGSTFFKGTKQNQMKASSVNLETMKNLVLLVTNELGRFAETEDVQTVQNATETAISVIDHYKKEQVKSVRIRYNNEKAKFVFQVDQSEQFEFD